MMKSSLRILSLVEATTLNAVARIVVEFHRAARELRQQDPDFSNIHGSLITFDRRQTDEPSPN